MNPHLHKIRCFKCDLRKVWNNLHHGKVAKWTLLVHFTYYIVAIGHESGAALITSAMCAVAILFDLLPGGDTNA